LAEELFQSTTFIIMNKLILLTSFLGVTRLSFGQSTASETKLSRLTKIDLGFQGIGFTYETGLSNKVTIDLSGGAGGGYDIAEGYLNSIVR